MSFRVASTQFGGHGQHVVPNPTRPDHLPAAPTPTAEATRAQLRQIGQLGNPIRRGPFYTLPDPLEMAQAFGEMLGELYPDLAYDAADLVARGVQQGKQRVPA